MFEKIRLCKCIKANIYKNKFNGKCKKEKLWQICKKKIIVNILRKCNSNLYKGKSDNSFGQYKKEVEKKNCK